MVNKFHDFYFGTVKPWIEAHPTATRCLAAFVAGFLVRSVL